MRALLLARKFVSWDFGDNIDDNDYDDVRRSGFAAWLRSLLSLVQLCSGILQCRFLIPKLSIHQLSKIKCADARKKKV
jgi:hypothetical protein